MSVYSELMVVMYVYKTIGTVPSNEPIKLLGKVFYLVLSRFMSRWWNENYLDKNQNYNWNSLHISNFMVYLFSILNLKKKKKTFCDFCNPV